jgi:hypothetical protein
MEGTLFVLLNFSLHHLFINERQNYFSQDALKTAVLSYCNTGRVSAKDTEEGKHLHIV